MLSYGDSARLPKGCSALAVSHGTNDSGQFQLDFNDGKYLPFEGIALDDEGTESSIPECYRQAESHIANYERYYFAYSLYHPLINFAIT